MRSFEIFFFIEKTNVYCKQEMLRIQEQRIQEASFHEGIWNLIRIGLKQQKVRIWFESHFLVALQSYIPPIFFCKLRKCLQIWIIYVSIRQKFWDEFNPCWIETITKLWLQSSEDFNVKSSEVTKINITFEWIVYQVRIE